MFLHELVLRQLMPMRRISDVYMQGRRVATIPKGDTKPFTLGNVDVEVFDNNLKSQATINVKSGGRWQFLGRAGRNKPWISQDKTMEVRYRNATDPDPGPAVPYNP